MFVVNAIIAVFIQYGFCQENQFQVIVNKNCTDVQMYNFSQGDNPGEIPTSALFYSEMQVMINNKINIDKNIRIDDCKIQNHSLQQLKYIVFFYLGENQKILVENVMQDWFVFTKYLILVQRDFNEIIKEGSLISIYNPYTESFQNLLVTRKDAYNLDESQQIRTQQIQQQRQRLIENTKEQSIKKTKQSYIKKQLQNFNTLINLPKNGGYILFENELKDNRHQELNQLQISNEDQEQDQKIYDYYFPSLVLEQGIIPRDAIREQQILKNQLVRKLFPNLEQNWTLFFFVKSQYHSIQGKTVFVPFYIKDAFSEQNEQQNFDKVKIQREFVQRIVNIDKVEKTSQELIVQKEYLEPPFQFTDQFMEFDEFREQLLKFKIKIFLKNQQIMILDQIKKQKKDATQALNDCIANEISNPNSKLEDLQTCSNLCVGTLNFKLAQNKKIDQNLLANCQNLISKLRPIFLKKYKLTEDQIQQQPQFRNYTISSDFNGNDKQKTN